MMRFGVLSPTSLVALWSAAFATQAGAQAIAADPAGQPPQLVAAAGLGGVILARSGAARGGRVVDLPRSA